MKVGEIWKHNALSEKIKIVKYVGDDFYNVCHLYTDMDGKIWEDPVSFIDDKGIPFVRNDGVYSDVDKISGREIYKYFKRVYK